MIYLPKTKQSGKKILLLCHNDSQKTHYDSRLKVVCLGDSGVGKTAFCESFAGNPFPDEYHETSCNQFVSAVIQIADVAVKVQLWDTPGSKQLRTVARTIAQYSDKVLILLE